jgi:hypothetical protein
LVARGEVVVDFVVGDQVVVDAVAVGVPVLEAHTSHDIGRCLARV